MGIRNANPKGMTTNNGIILIIFWFILKPLGRTLFFLPVYYLIYHHVPAAFYTLFKPDSILLTSG